MTQAVPEPTRSSSPILRAIAAVSGFVGKYGGRSLLMLIIFVMVYEVVARYVFGRPTIWALEIAIYSQVLFVALTAAYVLREEGHVSMGLLLEQFTERRRNWYLCASSIMGAIYSAVVMIQMWNTASWSLRVSTASETVGIPLAPLQFVLTAGLFLLVLQFVARSIEYGRKALHTRSWKS